MSHFQVATLDCSTYNIIHIIVLSSQVESAQNIDSCRRSPCTHRDLYLFPAPPPHRAASNFSTQRLSGPQLGSASTQQKPSTPTELVSLRFSFSILLFFLLDDYTQDTSLLISITCLDLDYGKSLYDIIAADQQLTPSNNTFFILY
jgi:hypothetical protein